MKKSYNTPKLSVHGSVEQLTQQTKSFGSDDGVVLSIPTPGGGSTNVPIGSI